MIQNWFTDSELILNCGYCARCCSIPVSCLSAPGGLHHSDDDGQVSTKFVAITNSTFINNKADLTGGAVFSNAPQALAIACTEDLIVEEKLSRTSQYRPGVRKIYRPSGDGILGNSTPCSATWKGNASKNREGGDVAATTAVNISLCNDTRSCIPGGGEFLITNHNSGQKLGAIVVKLFDAFGKPAYGQPYMKLSVEPADTERLTVSGQLFYNISKPRTVLNNTQLVAAVGEVHKLFLRFNPALVDDMAVLVSVRPCLAGEVERAGGELCITCDASLYSFDPSQNCTVCPDNAKCTPSTITPDAGFWHSTSKSTQIHSCILEEACNNKSRRADLEARAKKLHRSKNMLFTYENITEYPQCSKVGQHLCQ